MKRFKSIVIAALVVLIGAASAIPATPATAQSSASLSIVPKKTYTVEPGKSIRDTFTIRNIDAERNLDLNLRVVDFTYTDDGGTPKLMLAEDAPQTTWSMKPFLSIPETVSIPPNSSKTLDLSVSIPASQGAGSYYSAILYSSGAPDGGNVGLSASGVTLVFTNIPGEVNEDLKLEKFGAYVGKPPKYANFTLDMPQSLAYTLKNSGNVTASPVGTITLKHIFGKEQVIRDVNPNSSLALVGQTRTFTTCIKLAEEKTEGTTRSVACTDPGLWPGLYTAKLDLFYGQNGNQTQEISGTTWFWYLPGWFIILFVVVLGAIALGIWRLVYKFKNRRYGSRPNKKSFGRRR